MGLLAKDLAHLIDKVVEIDSYKSKNGLEGDTDLSEDDWKKVIDIFKSEIKSSLGAEFPDNAEAQLWVALKLFLKAGMVQEQ